MNDTAALEGNEARRLIVEAIAHFTSKKKSFTARDVRIWIKIKDEKDIKEQGQLVLNHFLDGGFPEGYILQMCHHQDVIFALYRYSRYAKEYDFSGLVRRTKQ